MEEINLNGNASKVHQPIAYLTKSGIRQGKFNKQAGIEFDLENNRHMYLIKYNKEYYLQFKKTGNENSVLISKSPQGQFAVAITVVLRTFNINQDNKALFKLVRTSIKTDNERAIYAKLELV